MKYNEENLCTHQGSIQKLFTNTDRSFSSATKRTRNNDIWQVFSIIINTNVLKN